MDQELVLEGAARAVDMAEVVNRGAPGVDPGLERGLDPFAQPLEFRSAQPPGRP
jgi:hypothetical protein